MQSSNQGKILRRVFWNLYAWPITLIIIVAAGMEVRRVNGLLVALDLPISALAVLALHLHIWDKRFLPVSFWRPYAFLYPIWDVLFNTVIEPRLSGKPFNPWLLFVPVILLPLYAGVFLYAFRSWDGSAMPKPPILPQSASGGL